MLSDQYLIDRMGIPQITRLTYLKVDTNMYLHIHANGLLV